MQEEKEDKKQIKQTEVIAMTGEIMERGYTIRCGSHTYITLEHDGKFIFCLDNDLICAEEMIYRIEKTTRMNFNDIPIKGKKDDFKGLSFFNGGWKRDFWDDFPSKKEIDGYMKMKYENPVMDARRRKGR